MSALAALAASGSPSRLGSAAPLTSAPLVAAPARGQGTRHTTNVARLRRSLWACTAEGMLAEVIGACAGGAILTAWALYLGASTLTTGALLAVSQLAQLFQFPAAWTTAWLGHRRACIIMVAASRQALLPLALLPFLPASSATKQAVLMAVASVAAVLGVLGNNAWVSWMGELVPRRVRGRYFGRRTALCTLGGALAAAAVGLALDGAGRTGRVGALLALLQLVGSAAGVVTTLLMLRQHDPAPVREPARLDLARLLAPLCDPAMRGLLVYLAAWNAAVGLAGSFFGLHMLRNLKMGFALVALHGTALAVVRMVAAPLWGRVLDRLGARPVLLACSFGICTIPFIWLFPSEHMLWPLVLDCLIAGVLWCGHGMAMFHLPLSITPRAERPFYLAAFASISGLAFSLATLAGGLVTEVLPDRLTVLGHPLSDLQVVFVMSGVLRVGAACIATRIHEPAAQDVGALWALMRARMPRMASIRAPLARPVVSAAAAERDGEKRAA